MRFEVLKAVNTSWSCGRNAVRTCRQIPMLQLRMEAAFSSETLVSTCKSTRCQNPEDQHRHCHGCENLKSNNIVEINFFLPLSKITFLGVPRAGSLFSNRQIYDLEARYICVCPILRPRAHLFWVRYQDTTFPFCPAGAVCNVSSVSLVILVFARLYGVWVSPPGSGRRKARVFRRQAANCVTQCVCHFSSSHLRTDYTRRRLKTKTRVATI
jgi:hypothetical protein